MMINDKLVTCVWFDREQAREAAAFYAGLFPDSHVGAVQQSPADNPSMAAGGELMVEFTVLGRPFLGLNGGPNFTPNEAVSFIVLTDNQEETDRYWDAIVDNGGAESACGWCKDRWGFSWQITPRALMEAMADPDRAAAKRAMEAMMTMQKIDIAAIERARAGEKADA
ncbi:VOC family protein [Sphingomonas sp. IC4-52]|uniref:VOC family protein n=1 Tax=Sphingomonas sp. IC4-52 TaxID=2887202 RepID=UPI0039F01411